MEKQRNDLIPRLMVATALFTAARCINMVNIQIHAVVPKLTPKADITRTSTVVESDKEVEDLMKEFYVKVYE